MKNIIQIFTSDLKKIFKNEIAIIIVCGLLILPSLYAWFNIYASWDPYGSTGGIMIAVCNQDVGGKIKDSEFNIGDELIENLKENDTLGWTFVEDSDDAINLARTGKVYASIIIPKDFSEKMSTIIDDNPMKPSLEYYVNEKVNAISPKITDKGASTLQDSISTAFIESVTEAAFEMLEEAGIKTEDVGPILDTYEKYLDHLIETIPTMAQRLDDNAKTVDSGSELVALSSEDIDLVHNVSNDLISFTDDFKRDIDELNGNSDEMSRELVETLNLTKVCLEDLDNNIVKLHEKVVLEKPDVVEALDESSANLKVVIQDTRKIQSSLKAFDKEISPEIESLVDILERQLVELESLLGKISDKDYNTVDELTKSIHESTAKIRPNLEILDALLGDNAGAASTEYNDIHAISKNLSDLFSELEGKAEITEKATEISDNIFVSIDDFNKVNTIDQAPVLMTLNSIERNLKDLKVKNSFDKALANLKTDQESLKKHEMAYLGLSTTLAASGAQVDAALSTIDAIDDTATTVNDDVNQYIASLQHYTKSMEKDVRTIRKNIVTIDRLVVDEKNYLIPLVKEITDISLNRLDDVSNILSDLSDDLASSDIENQLDNMHNLTTNMISNLDNLIIKINTDLTTSMQRYLSSTSRFLSDTNVLLVSLTDKKALIKDFSDQLAYNGQVAADDMIEISDNLPELQEDLISMRDRMGEFREKANLEEFVDKMQSNENVISDFMAYPVDLNSHSLYSTDNYGSSMTPFYTTLSLWVGVLILFSVLTPKSKNVDFKPTPLETYLGKYPLFAIMAVLQGLIVALGDLYLLKITAVEPGLFILLSMFLSLVFCTIIYTLVSLFGNVGKAIGIVLLVLQVAGSGGTFPIQMTPEFFQKLYVWLPFTYGIGALREAVFGVYFPALKTDLLILNAYFIIFFVIGLLFVSANHKHVEKISHRLEESGISE